MKSSSKVRPAVWVATFSIIAGVGAAGPAAADCNDPFGKPNEVLDFHIKMSRAEWNKLLASSVRNVDGLPPNSPACNDNFPEFPAEFRCGDAEPWIKIAVRKKRGTERGVEAPNKPPLKIDFNEDFMGKQPEAKGQNWPKAMGENGFRKLTLNNGQGNKPAGRTLILPLLMTEHVALRLLRREVPATPGTAYAKVTLHTEDKPEGEYHGVYILIEDIDRGAIRRRWGRADGRLSKMTKDNCTPVAEYDDGPPNESFPAFTAWLNKTPSNDQAWLDETGKVIDLDAFLRQEAIREILVNGDDTISYVTTSPFMKEGNNFFAFDPRQGPRQYMPWDVDLTFGQQNENCAPTPLMCAANFPLFRYCGPTQSKLGKNITCHPFIQKRYLEVMCQLTQGSMSAAEILKVWEEANAAVRPVVPLEKDVVWGGRDPLAVATPKSFGAEYERLKRWIPERIKSVQAQISAKGVACAATCTAGASEKCTHLGCAGERRCESGAWTTCQPTAACSKPMGGNGGGADGGAGPADGGAPSGSGGAGGAPTSPPSDGGAHAGSGGASGTPGGGSASGGGSGGAPVGSGGASGGTPPAATGGRMGGSAPAPADPAPGKGGGGCSFGGDGRASAAGWALAALGLALWRRRRARAGQ